MRNPLGAPAPRNAQATVALQNRRIPNPLVGLEDVENEATLAWLEQQHSHRSNFLGREQSEWLAIRDYVAGLPLYETDYFGLTCTEKWCFFTMQPPCVKQVNIYAIPIEGGQHRLLVDPTRDFTESGLRIHESCLEVSACGRYLVFSVCRQGQDVSDYRVLDLETECILTDVIANLITAPVAWKNDSSGFYYGAFRSLMGAKIPIDGLYFHYLGSAQSEDICLRPLSNEEQMDYVAVLPWMLPDSEQLLLMYYSYRHLTAGLSLWSPDRPNAPQVIIAQHSTQFAVLGVRNDQLYLNTTLDAENGRIVAVPLDNPVPDNWSEVVPTRSAPIARPFPGIVDNRSCLCGERLLITYLVDAKHQIETFDLAGNRLIELASPQPETVIGLRPMADGQCIISSSSFLQPLTFHRLNVENANRTSLLKFTLPAAQFDGVEVRQIFYAADDGQDIPLYLIGRDLDDRAHFRPLLLYGYGGFGQTITPIFNPDLPVWISMGGVYAVANIRGGGEYGSSWHEAARGVNRHVSFEDFRAAADFLTSVGLTDREHLAIRGISNGGLLVGASVVLHPDKWSAAIAEAPLLDMIQMLQQPGADVLCEEFGDLFGDEQVLDVVLGYSPVHNVSSGVDYPAVLTVPAAEDPRAHPCQSWKFVAQLQFHNPEGRPALISTVPGEGHVNWSTNNIAYAQADQMMFLRKTVKGVKPFGRSL